MVVESLERLVRKCGVNLMSQVSFNINYYVRFKPTKFGKDHYRKKRLEMQKGIKTLDILKDLRVESDGYVKLQMHEFMFYFGEIAYCGNKAFIENCEIFLSEDNLKRD